MIHLDCPRCAFELQLPDRRAGGVVRCPECEELLRIPTPGPPVAVAPPDNERPPPARAGSRVGAGVVALLAVIPLAGLFASLVLGGSLLQAPAPTPAADPDLGPAVTRPAAVVAEPEPEAAAVTVVDSLAAEHAP